MKPATTRRSLLTDLIRLVTATMLLAATGCSQDAAGPTVTALAADLARQLLAFLIL